MKQLCHPIREALFDRKFRVRDVMDVQLRGSISRRLVDYTAPALVFDEVRDHGSPVADALRELWAPPPENPL